MINEAVKYYNFSNCSIELLRHNENMTYKITDNNKSYILRIHKPIEGFDLGFLLNGKDKKELIEGEVKILEYLSTTLGTQHVKKNVNGDFVTVLSNGVLVTVLEWIDGCTLENVEITNEIAFKIGIMIGTMHNELSKLKNINRYSYDTSLIERMITELDKASNKGHFNENQRLIIKDTLEYINKYIVKSEKTFTLVHSDLSKSNLIYSNGKIIPIDFSLSGYSLYEMDLASVFSNIYDDELNKEILKGYESTFEGTIDTKGIDVFISFQILLFVIFQHEKFYSEEWFSEKVDKWCENNFKILITNK